MAVEEDAARHDDLSVGSDGHRLGLRVRRRTGDGEDLALGDQVAGPREALDDELAVLPADEHDAALRVDRHRLHAFDPQVLHPPAAAEAGEVRGEIAGRGAGAAGAEHQHDQHQDRPGREAHAGEGIRSRRASGQGSPPWQVLQRPERAGSADAADARGRRSGRSAAQIWSIFATTCFMTSSAPPPMLARRESTNARAAGFSQQ